MTLDFCLSAAITFKYYIRCCNQTVAKYMSNILMEYFFTLTLLISCMAKFYFYLSKKNPNIVLLWVEQNVVLLYTHLTGTNSKKTTLCSLKTPIRCLQIILDF